MKTQIIANKEETLLPPSLFEEEDRNSDNESDFSINFNQKLSLFNDDKVDEPQNHVNIIYNLITCLLQGENAIKLDKSDLKKNKETKPKIENLKNEIIINNENNEKGKKTFKKHLSKKSKKENEEYIKNKNSTNFNSTKKSEGINNINVQGINNFRFDNTVNNTLLNTVDIFQTKNFSEMKNNSNFNNINIINTENSFPSLININNINNFNGKNNLNQFLFTKNNAFNSNIINNNFNNINNSINQNINDLIFANLNISSNSNKKQFSNNITNVNNINNFNNIFFDNIIQTFDSNFNNFNDNTKNNINNNNFIFDQLNQTFAKSNSFYKNDINIYDNDNISQKNKNVSFFGNKKSNKKKNKNKKQNWKITKENTKEKYIRDFKLFCDGLKCSLSDYICSQVGSRIMQKYLNYFPSFIITNLIEMIYMNFERVMCDIYGNYFCQKLYTISSIEQRRMILNSIKDIFINISKTSAGAHVTQNIIEESKTKDEKIIIMQYIKGHEMELALHPEGTHVLQKIIQIFPEKDRQNLTDVLCTNLNINILCKDLKGISVIKRLISFNTEKDNKMKLVDSFYGNCLEISKSSSGSYIIQYLLEQWGVDIGLKLILHCIMYFESFAVCKHSANLIDKIILICLKKYSIIRLFGNDESINSINNEIIIINALKYIIFEPNKVINVYKTKYGKTLILKIRKLFSPEENEKLFLFIKSLETVPNYLESKKYTIYIEIFKSQ